MRNLVLILLLSVGFSLSATSSGSSVTPFADEKAAISIDFDVGTIETAAEVAAVSTQALEIGTYKLQIEKPPSLEVLNSGLNPQTIRADQFSKTPAKNNKCFRRARDGLTKALS